MKKKCARQFSSYNSIYYDTSDTIRQIWCIYTQRSYTKQSLEGRGASLRKTLQLCRRRPAVVSPARRRRSLLRRRLWIQWFQDKEGRTGLCGQAQRAVGVGGSVVAPLVCLRKSAVFCSSLGFFPLSQLFNQYSFFFAQIFSLGQQKSLTIIDTQLQLSPVSFVFLISIINWDLINSSMQLGLWWGFFNFGFSGDMTGYYIKGFFVFCNVLVVVVQVTAVCVLSVFIAPLLTVGLLPTTYYSAARRARQQRKCKQGLTVLAHGSGKRQG